MNALNPNYVPVKSRLSALAQLIGLLIGAGITSNYKLAEATGYSRRSVQFARLELEEAGGVSGLAPLRNILTGGVSRLTGGSEPVSRGSEPAHPHAQPAHSDDLPHGEKTCAAPMLYKAAVESAVQNGHDSRRSVDVSLTTDRVEYATAGNESSLAGNPKMGAAPPQTPTPSPQDLSDRLAHMLPGDDPERKADLASDLIGNLAHSYEGRIIDRALTRLQQKVIDGYKVKSYGMLLEAMCRDVEQDVAAKKPERPIPWGAIDLGNGRYVTAWSG